MNNQGHRKSIVPQLLLIVILTVAFFVLLYFFMIGEMPFLKPSLNVINGIWISIIAFVFIANLVYDLQRRKKLFPPVKAPELKRPYAGNEAQDQFWARACHLSVLAGLFIPFGWMIGPVLIWAIKKNYLGEIFQREARHVLKFAATIMLWQIGVAVAILVFLFPFLIMALASPGEGASGAMGWFLTRVALGVHFLFVPVVFIWTALKAYRLDGLPYAVNAPKRLPKYTPPPNDEEQCLAMFGTKDFNEAYARLGYRRWFNGVALAPVICLALLAPPVWWAVLVLGSKYQEARQFEKVFIFYFFFFIFFIGWLVLSSRYAWLIKKIEDQKKNDSAPKLRL